MTNEELVTIYTVNQPLEADLIRNGLEDEGIRVILEGVNEAINVGIVDEVKIQVPAADAERARAWIEEHHHEHTDDEEDDETGSEEPEGEPS